MFKPRPLCFAVGILALTGCEAVHAQALPSFGSIEARLGAVSPEKAKLGFSGSMHLDLGYVGRPSLRAVLGLTYFKADVDRRTAAGPVGGSLSCWGGQAGLRFDPLGGQRIAPYLTAVLAAEHVRADVQDPGVKELLDGSNVGAGLGGGLAVAVDSARTFAVTADVRRIFVSNLNHWTYELGLRFTPRGRAAYSVDLRNEAERSARERERLGAEREAQLAREREAESLRQTTVSPTTVEADRLKAERERLETERLRLEQGRLEAERKRGEDARSAAERANAQKQIDSLRVHVDSLEVARRREAGARAAAEQETAQIRAKAAAADSTLQAQRRRTEADAGFYRALLDLDRQSASVTAIRDTERGLTLVLGQGLFPSGRATLSSQASAEIGKIAEVLRQAPERRLTIEGHTDNAGSESANQRLSEERAEAVAAALIAAGVDPNRIDKVGYGSSQPVAENTTSAGRAQNRRVEIVILGARRP